MPTFVPPRERKVSLGRTPRGEPNLQAILHLESLFATEWYDALGDEVGGDAGELLRVIGHDASDQSEELRRILVAWDRAGGGDAARRLKPLVDAEVLALLREARSRAADVLDAASARAPTAEIAERLRELARAARAHAERLAEEIA